MTTIPYTMLKFKKSAKDFRGQIRDDQAQDELATSHSKMDLVNLTTSRQLGILAAKSPVRDCEHGIATSLMHLLSNIDLRKSHLLCPLALSRPLYALGDDPPASALARTDRSRDKPAAAPLALALGSLHMPTRLLKLLHSAYVLASLHWHNRPAMDLMLRPFKLVLSNSLRMPGPAARPCASPSHHQQ